MNKSGFSFEHRKYTISIKEMIVGIDILKLKIDVTILLEKGREKHKTFMNNPDDFKNLKT